MRIYTDTSRGEALSYSVAAQTTTQTSSAYAAAQEHDAMIFEVSTFTKNSGTGDVTPAVYYSPTYGGTYTELYSGAPISATISTPVRYQLLDVSVILTGFYKVVLTVNGTINYDCAVAIYPARRSMA